MWTHNTLRLIIPASTLCDKIMGVWCTYCQQSLESELKDLQLFWVYTAAWIVSRLDLVSVISLSIIICAHGSLGMLLYSQVKLLLNQLLQCIINDTLNGCVDHPTIQMRNRDRSAECQTSIHCSACMQENHSQLVVKQSCIQTNYFLLSGCMRKSDLEMRLVVEMQASSISPIQYINFLSSHLCPPRCC